MQNDALLRVAQATEHITRLPEKQQTAETLHDTQEAAEALGRMVQVAVSAALGEEISLRRYTG